MARYCFEESTAALSAYVSTPSESEALEHYKGLLRDTELVCAKDGLAFATHYAKLFSPFIPFITRPSL